jgi:hypothetical protein
MMRDAGSRLAAARRQVAVKVLRPELAATLGPDRFIREIAAGPWP